ncbi:MAG: TonB family protein [Opitutaceae bacterium]|nr:TonB family protein [Opitutaceae bacterium]
MRAVSIAAALVLGAWAGAQEVAVSPLQWSDLMDPPDTLPVLKSRLTMPFPRELRATPDISYILYEVVLDAKGRALVLHPRATTEVLLAAERAALQEWKFAPGKREGKAVNSAFIFGVLFNPASADEKSPDATPRLLEASLVRLPRPPRVPATTVIRDVHATAEIVVSEQGTVSRIVDVPAAIRDETVIALKNWRFAPARQGGQPVASTLRVPLIVVTAGGEPEGKVTQPPRATFQARPIYPREMRMSGMRGEVVVDFTVDIEGRVRNAYAIRSLNPSFDDPAIEAVRRWRFEPGRAGDRPVNVHMQVPIVFALDGATQGGNDGMVAGKKPDFSKLPPELRYDTPPKLRGSVRAVYPHAALVAQREGRAVVKYLVDERGRVANASVMEATAPEFGRALLAAVEQFVYAPALKEGRPGLALLAFEQEFRRDAMYFLVSDLDLDLMQREANRPETIRTLAQLDRPLKPLSQRPPRFPLALDGKVATGEAIIEFLVDEDGRARLPRIKSCSDEAFGYAAMQGIAAWRFEVPTYGGRAAVARVLVPVTFGGATSP